MLTGNGTGKPGPSEVVWSHLSDVSAFLCLLSTLSSPVGSLYVTILGVLLLCIWLTGYVLVQHGFITWFAFPYEADKSTTLNFYTVTLCSVQFNHSVVSNSLWPHEPQHTRPPCPSPTPGVHPNSCPLSRWCHPAISSSVVPFSSCPQFFPTSGSFQMSKLFASGGQNTGVSALASILPVNSQDWSPLEWTGWISL